MKGKKIGRRLLAAAVAWVLTAAAAVFFLPETAWAEAGGNDASYTYTVTLYAGNQGSFTGSGGVSVSGSGQVEYVSSSEIRITGLRYGDRISVNAQSGMVELSSDSRYYIRGIRESGQDNSTVGNSSFLVESDREYVIAYGVQGNLVSYQVRYEDTEGNTLAPSQTFYGAVGDRPVVAFQYLDGYQPQAYNLTGTLSSNEADNLFTFVYQPVQEEDAAGETEAETGGTAETGGEAAEETGAEAGEAGTEAGEAAGAGTGAGEEAGVPEGGETGETTDGGEAETAAGETEPESQEPQEIVDIDDEEVPLAEDIPANSAGQGASGGLIRSALLAGAAVLALAAAVYVGRRYWKKHRTDRR